MISNLSNITANAAIPDQLIHYVQAVSGLQSYLCGDCVLHRVDDIGVLIAYPANDPLDIQAMNEAVNLAVSKYELQEITVLSANKPLCVPDNSLVKRDYWYGISLPIESYSGKLKNMLKRAEGEVEIIKSYGYGAWTDEHTRMVEDFCKRKKKTIEEGSKYIFSRLSEYLASSDEVVLFSAQSKNKEIVACAIADFSAFATAFYMFAFRYLHAPPGSADKILQSICTEAEQKGHSRINLGLGIDAGVEFFKEKWGGYKWLSYNEYNWQIKKRSWFSRLFCKK